MGVARFYLYEITFSGGLFQFSVMLQWTLLSDYLKILGFVLIYWTLLA